MTSNFDALLFDLDQTIVDSASVAELRKQRQWQRVYAKIPALSAYPGIISAIQDLQQDHDTAIVTTAPSPYTLRVLAHVGLEFDAVVCYHDVKRIKPDGEGATLAIQKLGAQTSRALMIGDLPADIYCGRNAAAKTAGVLWGGADEIALRNADPDVLVATPAELVAYIRS